MSQCATDLPAPSVTVFKGVRYGLQRVRLDANAFATSPDDSEVYRKRCSQWVSAFRMVFVASFLTTGFTTAVGCFPRLPLPDSPQYFFRVAWGGARRIKRIDRRREAQHAVVIGEARAGFIEDSRTIFWAWRNEAENIENNDFKANELCWIAGAQAKAGLVEDAKQTFAAARKVATRVYDLAAMVRANSLDQPSRPLDEIAIAQASVGFFDDAIETLDLASDDGDKIRSLMNVARAQAQAGSCERARSAVDEILCPDKNKMCYWAEPPEREGKRQHRSHAVSEQRRYWVQERTEAVGAIAICQAKAGLFAEAHRNANEAEEDCYSSRRAICNSALREIAIAQAKAGLYPDARQTADKIRPVYVIDYFAGVDLSKAMGAIAVGQAEAGKVEYAKATLVDAQTRVLDWMGGNALALNHVAIAQVRSGLAKDAETNFARIRAEVDKLESLCDIASEQAEAGLTQDAEATFAAAFVKAKAIDSLNIQRQEALRRIASAEAEAGLFTSSRKTAAEIVWYADADGYRNRAWKSIAIAQARAGLHADAAESAEKMKIIGHDEVLARDEVYAEVAIAQARASMYLDAWMTTGTIEDPFFRSKASLGIGIAWANACKVKPVPFANAR